MADFKSCSKCKKEKDLNCFYKNKSKKEGLETQCKICFDKTNNNYKRTSLGLLNSLYSGKVYRTKRNGWKSIPYSKEKFFKWIENETEFNTLYDNWVKSNYKTNLRPSVDRLNDYKPYTLSNIRLTTWGQNKSKANKDRKNGVNNKASKGVVQICKETGKILKRFKSIQAADRATGIHGSTIGRVCRGKRKTAGGFIWKFKNRLK